MVNLMAETTAVRMSAFSLVSACCRCGSSTSGLTRTSLPRHSATTLRDPSSDDSQYLNSWPQMAGTDGMSCCRPFGFCDRDVINSFKECRSKY